MCQQHYAFCSDAAFHSAAKAGRLNEMRRLVARGASVGERDTNGATALHYAAEKGHYEVVLYLLGRGADVDAQCGLRTTPLHLAAICGHYAVVRLLVEGGGAQEDVQCSRELWRDMGKTALDFATRAGQVEVATYLRS
eukprot:Selendium_serpulae@DN4978_c0_g1_i11.p1